MKNIPPDDSSIEKDPVFTAVIAAGGSSTRMSGIDKLTENLEGKPVIIRTLDIFDESPRIFEIILVSSLKNLEIFKELIDKFNFKKNIILTEGGQSRQDSVLNGIIKAKTKYVAVHDGARPLLPPELLENLLDWAREDIGVIPVAPLTDTVKIVGRDGFIINTLPRHELFRAQTPQIFNRNHLIEAYKDAAVKKISLTDDASALERYNKKIRVITGSEENIKLTSPWDFEIAKTIIKKRETPPS